jgi:hypothetical protein
MLKLIPKALLAAMAIASFLSVSVAQADQTDIQKLWQSSGYAQAGKGMRTMKMMGMMDANGDHKVTKDEFMHYYEMVWDMMDKNHKGYMMEEDWITKELKKPGG